jgi:glycosyltransferase involved in cell wall biosynthesis
MTDPDSERIVEAAPRRLMVVSYFFPPLGGVGVQRTLKWIRHLEHLGWRAAVIAPRNSGYRARDPALGSDIPATAEVHRTAVVEPDQAPAVMAALKVRFSGARGRFDRRVSRHRDGDESVPPARADRPSTMRRLARRVWAAFVRGLVPDDRVGWAPFAVPAALRVHRRTPVDAIYSSSPPMTAHLVAGIVSRRTGLPWVADFRDPWLGNPFAPRGAAWRRPLDRRLERWIVSRADRVVFAMPTLRARYAERYPDVAGRFVTITNGYDRAEFRAPEEVSSPRPRDRGAPPPSRSFGPSHRPTVKSDRFRIVYAGSLYGETELELFLAGVELFLGGRPAARDILRIDFVGWFSDRNSEIAGRFLERGRISPVVEFHGFRPRSEALRRVRDADAVLQILADRPGNEMFLGAKLFEYLASGKPLLAVLPEGDARTMLAELGWGIVADPTPAGVADGLGRLLDAPAPTNLPDPEGRYDRSRLARRLAEVLDEAMEGHPRRRTDDA